MRPEATASPAGSTDNNFGALSRAIFAFAVALLLLWASTGVARAASSYVFQGESGNGTLGNVPTDIAVEDSTGRVFVADSENDRVVVFESTQPGAAVLTTFGEGELSAPYGIAIDQGTGDVYVSDSGNDRLVRYESDGAEPPVYTLDAGYTSPAKGTGAEEVGSFASPLAIDPTSGDLLLADTGNLRVERFDSSGAFLDSFDGADSTAGAFTSLLDIATAPDGTIYLIANGVDAGAGGIEGSIVDMFAADGTYAEELAPGQLGNARSVGYDAKLGNVLVTNGGGCFEGRNIFLRIVADGQITAEYEIPTAAECSRAVGVAVPNANFPFSILTAETSGWGGVGSVLLVKWASVDVALDSPSTITSSGAHLSGTVDPHGDSGSAHFEYRLVGASNWIANPDQSVSGEGPQPVEEDIAGLLGNVDYEVRLAGNVPGLTETSAAATFHTLLVAPAVETGNATSVTDTTAELNGMIDAIGDQTTYRFEYGLTTAYGSKVPAGAEGIAGNEHVPIAFRRPLSGLQPETTYHYRLVAKNSAGETAGVDRTVTTLGVGQLPPARAYERVTPANKEGGTINPLLGFQAAADGSALGMQLASVPPDGSSAPLFARFMSKRGPAGWLDWTQLDPPLNVAPSIVNTLTHAISPNFTHTMVVSNRALTPGAIEGGGNIYIQDLETGEYTFVGGAPGFTAFILMGGASRENMYLAGSPDFSWVVFAAPVPLLPGVAGSALYKWSRSGGLEVESRLPLTDEIASGSVRLPNAPTEPSSRLVSDDGNTMYFSLEGGEAGVYRRTGGGTSAISVSQIPGDPDSPVGGQLDGVSSDGRFAFFRTGESLTSDTPGPPPPGNIFLYRYDAESSDLEFVGFAVGGGGRVLGAGPDGQTIYYNNGGGTVAWSEGVSTAITPQHPDLGTAFGGQHFLSPNGRYLAYMGAGNSIHLYDADAEKDVCVSCSSVGDGGGLPGGVRTISNRRPEVVNDEGEMFFEAISPLIAADHNGVRDVYMYDHGNLSLISPGEGNFPAYFADASANGDDVFFSTAQSLVSDDVDQSVDVYDARIGGGFAPSVPVSECEGEGCRGPIGAPPDIHVQKGSERASRATITSLRALSSAQRKSLAKGKKASLWVTVGGPGTVIVVGSATIDGKQRRVIKARAKAKGAGGLEIPIALTKSALAELRAKGSLKISLSVSFPSSSPKAISIALKANSSKKGGRS